MGSKGGSQTQVTGFRYYMSMLMSLCRGPIDEIVQINAGGVQAWPGDFNGPETNLDPLAIAVDSIQAGTTAAVFSDGLTTLTDTAAFTINADAIFGGDQKEGGIQGGVLFNNGYPDQSIHPSPITDKIGTEMGDLRGIATLFLDHGHICSNNPYPKPWTFRVRRALRGWDGGTAWYPDEAVVRLKSAGSSVANIYAMNPAHIIYECLTNRIWGRGLPTSALDETSFISAANTLCIENFGLCMKWSRETDLDQFVQTVINHVGGALYVDRESGLLVLKLLRADYDPATLPVFDYASGLLKLTDDTSTAPDNSHSEIIVNWTDPTALPGGAVAQTRVQNLAGTQATQTIASATVDYLGVPTAELAARLAQRDLSLQAPGIKRYTVVLDRRGRKVTPGSVFRISVPTRGIVNMVLRAGKVAEGTAASPTITVTAIQDALALETTTYVVSTPPTWTPPDRTAQLANTRRVDEINYRDLVRVLPAANLAAVTADQGGLAVAAAAPTPLSTDYLLATHATGEDYALYGAFAWTPTATILDAIGCYDTTIVLRNQNHLASATIGGIAWLDDELVEVQAADTTTGSITIGRGCVDSVPAPHAAGARIWFGENTWSGDQREYTTGELIDVQVLTRTNSQALKVGEADEDTLTIGGRQGRPYPPADLKINGTPFGLQRAEVGDLVFTWSHRDRLTQADHILVTSDASTGPEAGTTYNIRVYTAIGVLTRTVSAISGTTWTYDGAMSAADGDILDPVFEVESERDGLVSWYKYHWTMHHPLAGSTGFDFDFNFEFDGI